MYTKNEISGEILNIKKKLKEEFPLESVQGNPLETEYLNKQLNVS